MLSVINNAKLRVVATTRDMPTALAWAETISVRDDFSIVKHVPEDFTAYTGTELSLLAARVNSRTVSKVQSRVDLVDMIIEGLDKQAITSELPPDAKRVATLNVNEDNEMATSKKAASKKAPAKKTATKKEVAVKAAPKKVPAPQVSTDREVKNGIMRPKIDSKAGQLWSIADEISKKTGAPAVRRNVVEEAVKRGLSKAGSGSDFQTWRQFHGLVSARA